MAHKLTVLLILAALTGRFAAAQTPASLVFDWKIVTAQGNGRTYATQLTDNLNLLKDSTFSLRISDTLRASNLKGSWHMQGDSLLLQPDSASGQPAQLFAVSFDSQKNLHLKSALTEIQTTRAVVLTKPSFSFTDIWRGLLGLLGLLFINWLLSSNRKAIDWKLVITGMSMQLVFAILVLKVPFVKDGFSWVAGGFVLLLEFSKSGAEFMFSGLVTNTNTFGYIFAFQILPTIVFFSALMSILYYLGLLQRLVYGIAWVMSKTMRLSGAESLSAAGNIFLGQTEAPLLIKPYLEKMTKSEMLSVMAGGMANIAGGVFAAYIGYLGGDDPVQQQIFATHLLTASILSAPAAMVSAKMLLPQTEEIDKDLNIPRDRIGTNLLEAISIGTGDGLRLAVNVGVMLMVFTSLIFMFNFLVADKFGAVTGLNTWVESATQGRYHQFNLQYIFGLLFAPVAWLLGVPADDMMVVGQLLGEKTIINEFVAYASLGTQKAAGVITHYKSVIIATYALCGFANFASIGIQIGGIGALAPGKRALISQLGIKALIGGTLASFYTASIAGMMISL